MLPVPVFIVLIVLALVVVAVRLVRTGTVRRRPDGMTRRAQATTAVAALMLAVLAVASLGMLQWW